MPNRDSAVQPKNKVLPNLILTLLQKTAHTNQTSLNVSTNAGSNSRPGSALKSGPGKAHQYQVLKQLRPNSANITPALAYKR